MRDRGRRAPPSATGPAPVVHRLLHHLVTSFARLFTAQPEAPASTKAGAFGWAVDDMDQLSRELGED